MNLQPLSAGIAVLFASISLCSAQTSEPAINDVVVVAREAAAAEPVEEKIVPIFSFDTVVPGTFWSLQQDTAPLPFLPFPELETFEIAPGVFLFDDRAVDYAAFQRQLRWQRYLQTLSAETGVNFSAMETTTFEDEPPAPGDGGTNEIPIIEFIPRVYGSNELWLEITNVVFSQDYAGLVLHNTEEYTLYDLQIRDTLSTNSAWMNEGVPFLSTIGQSWTSASLVLSNRTPDTFFIRARNYSGDADADGLPNGWELDHGLNPNDSTTTGTTADGDLDPDGDGYTNAEEFMLGYDPALGDPPRPTISISVTDGTAAEPGSTGQFTLTRSGVTTRGLTVYYEAEGRARSGTDFQALSGEAIFAVGQSSVPLSIVPVDDDDFEGTEDVVVRIVVGLDYIPAGTDFATLNITDNDLPPVSVDASMDAVVEGSGTNGMFRFYRDGDLRLPLTVNFALTGTATNGMIYQTVPTSITFSANADQTNLTIVPINNTNYNGITTNVLTILANAAYRIETNVGNASLTFEDDDAPYVNVFAVDADARESGLNPGRFSIVRTGTTNETLEVFYRVSGSAEMCSSNYTTADFQPLIGIAVIEKGKTNAFVDVLPRQDTEPEPMETIIITLAGHEDYRIGTSNSAVVNLDDDEPLSYVYKVTRPSIYGPSVGRFMPGEIELTRRGSALAALSVPNTVTDTSGNTINVGNYVRSGDFIGTYPNNIYFAPNQSVAKLKLNHKTTSVTNMQLNFAGFSPVIPCWGADCCVMLLPGIRDFAIEGGGIGSSAEVLVRRPANGPPLTVKLLFSGLANPGTDTTITNGQLVTFVNNTSQVAVPVLANSDAVTEGWEHLSVRLDTSDLNYTTYDSEEPQDSALQETFTVIWFRESATSAARYAVDTDQDLLSDIYEVARGFNPLIRDDIHLDGDKDGLSLMEEHDANTNPSVVDSDSDSVADFIEILRGTNPTNATSVAVTPFPTVPVRIVVGDESGSKSERWQLIVGNLMVNNTAPGQLLGRKIQLKEGTTNQIRLRHLGSVLADPDLDYTIRLESADAAPAAFFLRDPQQLLGQHWDTDPPGDAAQFTNKVATIVVPKVELTWTNKGDNLPLDLNTNGYSGEVRGNRIFVGAKTPTENNARNTVLLKIKTTPPLVGSNVWLKAFDVDDTTPDSSDPAGIIDSTARSGEDNFADYLNTPNSGVFTNGFATNRVTLNASGEAFVEFRVGMQPGNNYRIAASVFPTNNLETLQTIDPAGTGFVSSYTDKVRTGFNGVLSPVLTVWRKLHLEFDSMETVATSGAEANFKTGKIATVRTNTPKAGQSVVMLQYDGRRFAANELEDGKLTVTGIGSSFTIAANYEANMGTIYGPVINTTIIQNLLVVEGAVPIAAGTPCSFTDDDNYLLAEASLPAPLPKLTSIPTLISKLQPLFMPVCIDVSDGNAAGWNLRPNLPSRLNEPALWPNNGFGTTLFDNVQDVSGSSHFWSHLVAFGYQPESFEDGDPQNESPLLGGTPKGAVAVRGGERYFC